MEAVTVTSSTMDQPIQGCAASFIILTKCGLESISGALPIEFASQRHFSGVLNTRCTRSRRMTFKQLSPLNRLAEVTEVPALVQFLESSPFINGEVIILTAGKCRKGVMTSRIWSHPGCECIVGLRRFLS